MLYFGPKLSIVKVMEHWREGIPEIMIRGQLVFFGFSLNHFCAGRYEGLSLTRSQIPEQTYP